ncbi:MAG: tRNA (adenosine(37)-N6)-dimethylallyltransferase MiaA [Christensenellales bacterium]
MMRNKLIAIVGPTASGKTSLGISLAVRLNGEIVSADSVQVYRGMDIGSAKPSAEEQSIVPHHMIDVVTPDAPYNVSLFSYQARQTIKDIHARNKLPIVVGGTGLYVSAILRDMNFTDSKPDYAYRAQLEQIARQNGNAALHAMLREKDEASALAIHPNNKKRVIRALEIYHQSGQRMSEQNGRIHDRPIQYDATVIGLDVQREILYQRIDQRADEMLQAGLLHEVKVLTKEYGLDCIAFSALGYQQLIQYLKAEIAYDDAVAMIKRETRRFSKRQMTWFKRDPLVRWVQAGERGGACIEDQIMDILRIKEC